jgi:hypothetical protein
VLESRGVSDEALPEPPPAGLAPWEPWVFYGTFVVVVGAMLLRNEQAHTHSHGVRLLVSILMLVSAIVILAESVCVLFDIRGALWKISGRPAEEQLKLGSERKPWNGFSPRMWCGVFVVAGVLCLAYAISGL